MNRFVLLLLLGCGNGEPAAPPAPTSPPPRPPVADAAAPPTDPTDRTDAMATSDGADDVARLVVHDVGSKALGSQVIAASCVSVLLMPAGAWTVATAHLTACGDKTARSIVWLYKRRGNGKWTEDYVGQPPKCWKGVPADLRDAVVTATRIPTC